MDDPEGFVAALSDLVTRFSKGWLPSSVSENDLSDGDFAWLSDAYKAGRDPKSRGRKLPYKVHGVVNEDGWKAAWTRAHQDSTQFEGGPSQAQVIATLLRAKPVNVTVSKAEPIQVAITFSKADVDLRHGVIFGTAASVERDHQGDEIAEGDLEEAAYAFMAKANRRATDTHGPDVPGDFVASWVEKGTWRIGFRPQDVEIAKAAARGEYVGFSIAGQAERED